MNHRNAFEKPSGYIEEKQQTAFVSFIHKEGFSIMSKNVMQYVWFVVGVLVILAVVNRVAFLKTFVTPN